MKVDDRTEEELRLEAERLGSFAGMRKIGPSSDGLQSDAAGGPLSPLAEACICLFVFWSSGAIMISSIHPQMCETAAELEALGLAGLKAELQRIGLKCGGTLQARCTSAAVSQHYVHCISETFRRPRGLRPLALTLKREL